MILLDTNVLIYGFDPASPFQPWAAGVIRNALLGEGAAINPMILAELCIGDHLPDTVASRLEQLGFVMLDLPAAASLRCARAYADYLENRRQQTVTAAPKPPLPDFFIGAHASLLNLTLATADFARYETYFPEVRLIKP